MDVHEQLKESEVTQISEELKSFGSVIDKVLSRKNDIKKIDSIVETVEGWLKDGQLNTFDRLMSYYILGQAYNTQKCLTYDPSKAMFNHPLAMKEIYCYRMTMHIVDEIKEKGIWSLYNTAKGCEYQANVHLGNVYDHLGRHQDALHSYYKASTLVPNDYMWKFNLGFSFGGMFGYYEARVQPFLVDKSKKLLSPYLNKPQTKRSAMQMYDRVKDLKIPDNLNDKTIEYEK